MGLQRRSLKTHGSVAEMGHPSLPPCPLTSPLWFRSLCLMSFNPPRAHQYMPVHTWKPAPRPRHVLGPSHVTSDWPRASLGYVFLFYKCHVLGVSTKESE